MNTGFDGLIYSIGFLVGWPVITFLMAERLRNWVSSLLLTWHLIATSKPVVPSRQFLTLVVVAFYLIAQMVGAGQLIKLLFGMDYIFAVIIVGALMMVYVPFGGKVSNHLGTNH